MGLDRVVATGRSGMLDTVPVAIVFFSFQRYVVQGVAAAGVKG